MLPTTDRKSVTGFRNNGIKKLSDDLQREQCLLSSWFGSCDLLNAPTRDFLQGTQAVSCVDFTVSSKILAHPLLVLQAGALTSLPHLTGCFHKTCGNIIVCESSVPLSAWSSKLSKWTQLEEEHFLCLQNWSDYMCRFLPVMSSLLCTAAFHCLTVKH